mgnify:CR=1 FL=1
MKTLIIDDDTDAVVTLADKLKDYKEINLCETANTGEIGVKLALDVRPELIFLDVDLPDMTGIDFLSRIKELTDTYCKVVMYTSHRHDMLSAFRNNAFDYLSKPLDANELDCVVKRAFEERIPPKPFGTPSIDTLASTPNKEKLLFYTNATDFRLVHLKDIGLFRFNHEQRAWEVVLAYRKDPIKLKRNANNESLKALDNRFVQVSQRFIININYLLEVNDSICRFYPPFDKIDYVKVGRMYKKKLVSCFNTL